MGKVIAAYGGGFKPPTKGHLEVVKRALESNPEIDEFIIYVGGGERDGITQAESILIWEIFKKHLPMKVKIEPSKAPIGSIVRLGKNNPQDTIYFVIGGREGRDDDMQDIESRTKNIEEKYPNMKIKVQFTPDEGMSGTNARKAAKLSSEKFSPFLPDELSDEEKGEVYDIVRPVISERGKFAPDFDEDEVDAIEDFADDKMRPDIDIDLSGQHFFDRLNDPRNYPDIEPYELEDFFEKLSDKKDEFIAFLKKYKEMVAKDTDTNINIPFMKIADKAIAKTIMRKKNFASSTPILPLQEGRYDAEVTMVSRMIINLLKDTLGEKVEETFEDAGEIDGEPYNVEVYFHPTDFDTLGPLPFIINAAGDEDAIAIQINYRPELFEPKALKNTNVYNELIPELKDAIRHELEHTSQGRFNKGVRPDGIDQDDLPLFDYLTLDYEIPAFVQGIYKNAKTKKIKFSQALQNFLDERMDELTPDEEAKIKKIYTDYAKKNLPAAQINEVKLPTRKDITNLVNAVKQQGGDTKKAFTMLVKAAKGNIKLTDDDKEFIKTQLKDTLKSIGFAAIFALPAGSLVLALMKAFKLAHFITPTSFLNEIVLEVVPKDILDSFDIQDTLVQDVWDGEKLKPEIREKLLKIAQDFFDSLDLPEGVKLKDIKLTGSLANYNWSKFSDVDLHLVLDYSDVDDDEEFVRNYFMAKKSIWNDAHDITIFDFPVEVYVENEGESHTASGLYSVLNDKWIVVPKKQEIMIDKDDITTKAEGYMSELESIQKLYNDGEYEKVIDKVDKIKERLRDMRSSGLEKGGEYSVENLAFKVLRRSDFIGQLNDLKSKSYDTMMTLKEKVSLNENTIPSINIIEKCAQLTQHMIDKGYNIEPLPSVEFVDDDTKNAEDFFGKTAYYDPNEKKIVLYTSGRHPKDIVRSYAHEMIHHMQNLEDRLGNIQTTNTQEDDHLNDLEAEANLKGTMTFRNWTDSLEEKKNKDPFGLNAYALELARGLEEALRVKEEDVSSPKTDYMIYSDMDGVITDFDTSFMNISDGIRPSEYERNMGKDKFWELIDGRGVGFWVGMPWMSDGKSYWDYIKKYNPVLLSSPSRSNTSRLGKRLWVRNNLPGTKLILAQAKDKQNYARKNRILIDDRPSNIDEWRSQGGIGILHTSASNTIRQLKELGL